MAIEIIRLHHNLPSKAEYLRKTEDYHSICGIWFKLWRWGLKVEWSQSGRTKHCSDCGRRVDITEWYYRDEEYLCPECFKTYFVKNFPDSNYAKKKWPELND